MYFSPTGFAETFDTEVLHAIFVTRILHDYRKLDHYGREILSQYLASRALTDTRGNNGLTATIRYVADSLQGADGNDRQQKLEENSKALCRLATKYLSEKRVLEILETETQQTVDKVRDKSTYQEQKNDPSTHNSPTNSLDDSATDVLVGAAFLGDVDKVRGILRAMNKPRRKSRFFGSPVSAAAGGGHGDIFMLLLDHGVSPDLEGPTRTWDPPVLDPLLATCWGGHLSIVRQCLDSKCSSTLRLSEAAATLEAACGGHLEILQLLAARQTTSLSSKVFKMAAQMGHEEIVRVFLDRNLRSFGFEVAKEIAFEAAARYGQTHIVRMFLAPEYTHKYDLLYNSLEARALTGFKNSVEVLLAAGASVNDVEPAFLVLVAAADGHAHIVEFLLENGADFQVNRQSRRCLILARKAGHDITARNALATWCQLRRSRGGLVRG